MEQLGLPFPLDKAKLATFLTQWCALENEEDRLREDKRLLKEDFMADLPLRAVLVAVKIARATAKLEAHPKEAMARGHLTLLTDLVERHLREVHDETAALVAEATGGVVVQAYDVHGEVPHA